jgi:hypothetical protein
MNSAELKYQDNSNLLPTDTTDLEQEYKHALVNYKKSLLRNNSIKTVSSGIFSTLKLIVVLITFLIICHTIMQSRIKQKQIKSTNTGNSPELQFFNFSMIFLVCTLICKEILDMRRIARTRDIEPSIIQVIKMIPTGVIPEQSIRAQFIKLLFRSSDKILTFTYLLIRAGLLYFNKAPSFNARIGFDSLGLIFSDNKIVWTLIILSELAEYIYSKSDMQATLAPLKDVLTPLKSAFRPFQGVASALNSFASLFKKGREITDGEPSPFVASLRDRLMPPKVRKWLFQAKSSQDPVRDAQDPSGSSGGSSLLYRTPQSAGEEQRTFFDPQLEVVVVEHAAESGAEAADDTVQDYVVVEHAAESGVEAVEDPAQGYVVVEHAADSGAEAVEDPAQGYVVIRPGRDSVAAGDQ